LINLSGKPVEMFWIDTFGPSLKLVPQTRKPVRNNSEIVIHSFAGHQFNIRFLKHLPNSDVNFTKASEDEVIKVYFDEVNQKLFIQQSTQYSEGITLIREAIDRCEKTNSIDSQPCIKKAVVDLAKEYIDSYDTLSKYRDIVSNKLRNYTCANDDGWNTSAPIRSYEYLHLGIQYRVDVLLDTDRAKIWLVHDFVTEEECEFLINYARPQLAKGTVIGANSENHHSDFRKIQQAGYEFDDDSLHDDELWLVDFFLLFLPLLYHFVGLCMIGQFR
jgi:hypothetical protein